MHTNMNIMGMPKQEEREEETENLLEKIMTENFSTLLRDKSRKYSHKQDEPNEVHSKTQPS